jgi:DtxR family transcriptional regulator, Mn-dependent transcriptional regulator
MPRVNAKVQPQLQPVMPINSEAQQTGGPPQSAAVENYLKAIYALEVGLARPVTTGAVAASMGVSAPSASNMVRRLARLGLADLTPGRGVVLTSDGRRIALAVVRRHRILETYLRQQLDLPWDEVHAEAEVLEHALSPALAERLWDALGCPSHDPSGDPIPPLGADLLEVEPLEPVSQLVPGEVRRLVRVSEEDPEALRFLAARSIGPGARIEVLGSEPFGSGQRVRIDDQELVVGPGLGRLLFVERR